MQKKTKTNHDYLFTKGKNVSILEATYFWYTFPIKNHTVNKKYISCRVLILFLVLLHKCI